MTTPEEELLPLIDTENRELIKKLQKELSQTNDLERKTAINKEIDLLKKQTGIEGGRRRTNKRRRTNRKRKTKRRKTKRRRVRK
jgi:hypothetical protein